jgi:Ca2+-binding RTX toxin-like protein
MFVTTAKPPQRTEFALSRHSFILKRTAGKRVKSVREASPRCKICLNKLHTLNGDAGNDNLIGAAGRDFLFGGIGNDRISGGNGSDPLVGGAGNDQLQGHRGNDVLNGGNASLEADAAAAQMLTLLNWSVSHIHDHIGTFSDDVERDALNGGGNADTFYSGTGDFLRDARRQVA